MTSQIKELPHPRHFAGKLFRNLLWGCSFMAFSILLGIMGYHYFFHLSWVDSLYNASMILTGMGPVDAAPNDSAKVFASLYALYSGVAFLTCVAVILSPAIHRFLHRFKLDVEK
ncbi:MAG: hypothetical protein JNL60_04050 [Bacteroidia bacterium]|nr:hypothetical protein [Bacteroidia bacterium]